MLMLELRRSNAMDLWNFSISVSSLSKSYTTSCSCSYFPSPSATLSLSLLSFGSFNSMLKMVSFNPSINSFYNLIAKLLSSSLSEGERA